MMERFCVVLGDVVSSTKSKFREHLQKSLEDACQVVNSKYPQDIYANFKLLKGTDEIGGALYNITDLFRILVSLEDRVFPEKIRFVVVFDYVDIGIDTRDISKMDGPAFHRASDDMSALKKTDLLLRLSIDDGFIDSMIEGEINLMFLLRSNWTSRQHEIINCYEELHSSSKVADKLEISHQAVTSTLKRAKWGSLSLIEKTLNEALLHYHQRLFGRQDIDRNSINRNSTNWK